MTTPNDSGIVFDPKSGISEEEQRAILAKIDNIAEKNRLSLSESKKPRFKAKKTGGFFPVIVNVIAFTALAGGMFLISSVQWKTDSLVRTGGEVYNSVERALIEEIRRETLSLLEANEKKISLIISKFGEIDAEEYAAELAVLRNERSRILEDSRAKEAVLLARLENRSGGSADGTSSDGTSTDGTSDADAEMARLNTELGRTAEVEAQMGAFFANLNRQIADNNLEEAAETISAMRIFITSPAFQSLRSVQSRKEMYNQLINTFETMLEETAGYKAMLDGDDNAANPLSVLRTRVARLEQDLAEKEKTIEAVSSQGSGATRRLNELEKTNKTLQTENRQLQTDLDRRSQSETALRQNLSQITTRLQQTEKDLQNEKTETARLTQTVNDRDNTIRTRDAAIAANKTTIENRDDIIKKINDEVNLDRDYDEIPPAEIKARIARIQAALRSLN